MRSGGRQVEADVCAGADPGRGKALADQAVVSRADGGARHAEPGREFPRGRQGFAALQASLQDRRPELAVDLTGEIAPADQTDVEFHAAKCNGELDWCNPPELALEP